MRWGAIGWRFWLQVCGASWISVQVVKRSLLLLQGGFPTYTEVLGSHPTMLRALGGVVTLALLVLAVFWWCCLVLWFGFARRTARATPKLPSN